MCFRHQTFDGDALRWMRRQMLSAQLAGQLLGGNIFCTFPWVEHLLAVYLSHNINSWYQNLLGASFFLWNLGEPTIACLKLASLDRQGLPGGVVAWCEGDAGGLDRGLSGCALRHGWCLGLTCTKGLQTLKYKAVKQKRTQFREGKNPPLYENKKNTNENH